MALGFEKLTDSQLAQVYLQFSQDYNTNKLDANNYNILYNRLYWSMYRNSASDLFSLPEEDKRRLFHCLNIFWTAKSQNSTGIRTTYQRVDLNPAEYNDCCYCRHDDDFVFKWLLLSSLYANATPSYGRDSHRRHGHNHHSWAKDIQTLLVLLFIAVALSAFIYLTSKMLDACERLWYGEDSNRALWVMSMTLAGAFMAAYLVGIVFLPLFANPIGLGIAVAGSALIAGAVTAFVSEKLYAVTFSDNSAIDSSDPERFSLTRDQMINLQDKGFDLFAVDCAILALRHKIGEKGVPTYLKRMFWNTDIHQAISQLHQLKLGKLDVLTIDGMTFQLKTANQPFQVYQDTTTYIPPAPVMNPNPYEYVPHFSTSPYQVF